MNEPRIRVRRASRASLTANITLLVLAACTIIGLFFLDGRDVRLFAPAAGTGRETGFFTAFGATLRDLGKMFFDPRAVSGHFSFESPVERFLLHSGLGFLNTTLGQAVYAVIITLGMGFLTTLIGAVIALLLGLLASRNLSNPRISLAIKGFVALIRAVPTVLWVLIFAVGAGLGSVAAVVGMSFHSVAYLVKAYSESFEEIDVGVIEALKASGANWLQIVFQAVLPSSMGYILSWSFVRFEINFTTAVAMGAAAGAGGIGYNLWMSSYFLNIREMGYITYLILAVAIAMEFTATRLKKKHRLNAG
jgi:phosphonate transport system permease protein